MKNTLTPIFISFLFILFVNLPVQADEVIDAINQGLKNYKDGNYTEAVQNLDYAAQLIRQKKGGKLEDFLPEPLSGWTAEKAKSSAVSGAMFGGGVSAERSYRKGSSTVQIQIMADSPMLQGMMMMISNPMIASSDGAKLEQINGQKTMVKYDEANKSGELSIVVGNRYLIQVDGSDVTKEELKSYASKIDFKKLAALE